MKVRASKVDKLIVHTLIPSRLSLFAFYQFESPVQKFSPSLRFALCLHQMEIFAALLIALPGNRYCF